jgi:hypothetical protein
MEYPGKRSASVTAAAVVAILGGLFVLLVCSIALFGLLFMKLPGTSPELPPFVRRAALAGQGFMVGLSLFGIATGVGLIYLRKWARISILIWGGLSAFFGAIGIPVIYFMRFSPTPDTSALTAESMQAVRWILLVIYGLPLLIGAWWLILFNRKSVKAQFAGALASGDSGLPQKPSCPLPIAVLAWFYVSSILNLLFLPLFSFHFPIFIFGWLPHGRTGLTILISSCLAFFVAGIGLLKLKPWGYSLTLGLQLFWLASTAVTLLSPNYKAAMDSYVKEIQAFMHLPETQFSSAYFSQNYGWTVALGLLVAGAILGLLVYYRPRFLDAASRAAADS